MTEENINLRRNALIFGGLLGAIIGTVAAFLLVKSIEESEETQAITPARGMRLGMLVMNFLRQISNL